jgi:hypothetical protein
MAVCPNHSGIAAEVENLKSSDTDQWEAIAEMRRKYDGVLVRLNVLLGTAIISLIVLFVQGIGK